MAGWIIGPIPEQVAAQAGTGRGEVIAGQFDEFAGIAGPLAQRLQQPRALVEVVAAESHQQVAALAVAAADQLERFLGRGAEFTAEAQLLAHFRQQGHGALGREIVEAEGHQGCAAPSPIGGQQVQLAAEAVAEPQHPLSRRHLKGCRFPRSPLPIAPEGTPGVIGLALVVEARHVAPGPHVPSLDGQGFQ